MLVYHPRHVVETGIVPPVSAPDYAQEKHPFEAYCNWSYPQENQLSREVLVDIITRYDEKFDFMYHRILNEVPRKIVSDFIQKINISSNGIKTAKHRFLAQKNRGTPIAL